MNKPKRSNMSKDGTCPTGTIFCYTRTIKEVSLGNSVVVKAVLVIAAEFSALMQRTDSLGSW